MAGEKQFDELELDLELDVAYNEFDDEFKEINQQTIKHSNRLLCKNANTPEITENSNELDVCACSTNNISNKQNFDKFANTSSKPSQLIHADSDEGELKSEDDFDFVCKTKGILEEVKQNNEIFSADLSKKEGRLTSDIITENDELAMDVDEDQLLESEDESKCEIEEKKSEKGNEDQVMKVLQRSRAGKKKKKERLKFLKQRVQNERKIHPKIGRLFRPLTAREDDTSEFLAKQLADRLEEGKDGLILRVVNILGHKKAIEMFEETKKIQVEGGMFTSNNSRRRTSGGIFLNIMKTQGYATKEQMKEIYAEEKEKEKQLIKQRLQEQKELEEKQKHDLRELLTKKKELLAELEKGNDVDK